MYIERGGGALVEIVPKDSRENHAHDSREEHQDPDRVDDRKSFQSAIEISHSGGNPGANLKRISHRCYLREIVFEWELTNAPIYLPLGGLQGGTCRVLIVMYLVRHASKLYCSLHLL